MAGPRGELDGTFGENGRLTIQEASFGGAILQQPDGKLLVLAGYATGPDYDFDFAVLRLHPDGSPDESFGTSGRVMIDFAGSYDHVTRLALQPDGKIIAAGASTSVTGSDFALARFNPDGSIDVTFDGDGLITLDLGGDYEGVEGILLLENGQFVITGTTYADSNPNIYITFARFDNDGALDSTFGTGPIAGTTLIDAGGVPFWITRQPDGKFVACGVADAVFWDYIGTMMAVRVNADGSMDAGFGSNGIARIERDSRAETCTAMSDGTILLAGFQGGDLAFARLTSDGMKDATFGSSGISRIDLGGVESVQAMIPLNDAGLGVIGRIVAVRGNVSGTPTDIYFARVDPDSGLLDPGFGNNGVTIVDFGLKNQSAWSEGLALIQQTDGKLVAVGNKAGSGIPLARVDSAGTGNAGFAGFVETSANVTEGAPELLLGVRRTGGGTGELSVDYDTVAGTATTPGDFTPSFGTLHWTSGDMDPKYIRVPIMDDNIDEGNENFTIVLSNSSGGLAASEFLVTIADKVTVPSPPPSSGGGSPPRPSSGGGGLCLELLMLVAMGRWRWRRPAGPRRQFSFTPHLLEQRALPVQMLLRLLVERLKSRMAPEMLVERVVLGQIPPPVELPVSHAERQLIECALIFAQHCERRGSFPAEIVLGAADTVCVYQRQGGFRESAAAFDFTCKDQRVRVHQ
jgi:uncharacterized delta-60 repeat protein